MGNFLINQKIKKIKEFDSFDSLINWEDVHTSYLHEGQCSTDKFLWKLIIMYTKCYNSISCYGWTINKMKQIKKSKSLILLILWLFNFFPTKIPPNPPSPTSLYWPYPQWSSKINQIIKNNQRIWFFDFFDFLVFSTDRQTDIWTYRSSLPELKK